MSVCASKMNILLVANKEISAGNLAKPPQLPANTLALKIAQVD